MGLRVFCFWPQNEMDWERADAGWQLERKRGVNRLWCVGKGHVPLNGRAGRSSRPRAGWRRRSLWRVWMRARVTSAGFDFPDVSARPHRVRRARFIATPAGRWACGARPARACRPLIHGSPPPPGSIHPRAHSACRAYFWTASIPAAAKPEINK
jgi:hypothetical protein